MHPIASIAGRRRHPARRVHDRARLAAAIADAVEAERARTRAWLHDTLLQQLEYLAAGGYADAPDPAELVRVAGVAAAELRGYVEDVAPAGDGTLAERLRAVVAEEQLRAAHEVRLVFGDVDGSVEGEEAGELVAAVREALTNVRKHARARRALVTCRVTEGQATVVVQDDGQGFDPRAAALGAGLRQSIVGRVCRQGGAATIDSRPGEGTRVTLKLYSPLLDTGKVAA